jgi:hypothetical protein
MTGPEYDAELEAFLKRRSPMHRRLSDIDHAEPSVELDRLVLNRAREAIDTPSPALFRSSRWALPVGLAATILVAFTVVLNIDHQGAKVASNASPAAEAAPQAPAPAVARAASVREPERVDPPRLLTDSAASERREVQTEKKVEAPVAAMARRSQAAKSQNAASTAADSSTLIASTGAAVSQVPAAPPPPAPPVAAAAADPHSTPDTWLREINRLRTAGRTADADRELAAFREAYPTHPAYSVAKPPTR